MQPTRLHGRLASQTTPAQVHHLVAGGDGGGVGAVRSPEMHSTKSTSGTSEPEPTQYRCDGGMQSRGYGQCVHYVNMYVQYKASNRGQSRGAQAHDRQFHATTRCIECQFVTAHRVVFLFNGQVLCCESGIRIKVKRTRRKGKLRPAGRVRARPAGRVRSDLPTSRPRHWAGGQPPLIRRSSVLLRSGYLCRRTRLRPLWLSLRVDILDIYICMS